MPNITNIVLADGQTTPANRTFDVASAQMGSTTPAVWYERTAGTFNGFKTLTLLVRRANGSKSTKVSVRIVDPALNVDGTIMHNTLFNGEFTLPDTASLQHKKDILAFAKNMFGTAMMQGAIHDTSPAY